MIRRWSFAVIVRLPSAYHFIRRGGGEVKGGGGGSFSSIPAGGENLISYDSTGHFVFSVFLHNRHGRTSIGEEDEEFPFILPRFDSDLPVLNYRPERERKPGLVSSQKNLNT
jgi:hypothetical protein